MLGGCCNSVNLPHTVNTSRDYAASLSSDWLPTFTGFLQCEVRAEQILELACTHTQTYPRSLTRSSCPGRSSIHPGASSLCSHQIPSCPLIRQQALSLCWTCGTDGRPDGASEMSDPPLPGNCNQKITNVV